MIWLAEEPIAGSADAVARLRAAGHRVVFATNNASPTVAELLRPSGRRRHRRHPRRHRHLGPGRGIAAGPGVDSAVVCAERGRARGAAARGVTVVADGPADAVVVGLDPALRLRPPRHRRHRGARRGPARRHQRGPHPPDAARPAPRIGGAAGGGGHRRPGDAEVAGKPHEPLVALLRARAPDVALVVGDRPSTDGALARRLGVPFALVRTGVTAGGREPRSWSPTRRPTTWRRW